MDNDIFLKGGNFVYSYYTSRLNKKIQVPPFSRKRFWFKFFFISSNTFFLAYFFFLILKKGKAFSHFRNSDAYYFGHASVNEKSSLDLNDLRLCYPSFLSLIRTLLKTKRFYVSLIANLEDNGNNVSPEITYFIFVYTLYYVFFYFETKDCQQNKIIVVDDYIPELVGGLVAAKHNNLKTIVYSLHFRSVPHLPPVKVDNLLYWEGSAISDYLELVSFESISIKMDKEKYSPIWTFKGAKVVILLNAFFENHRLFDLVSKLNKLSVLSISVRYHPRTKKKTSGSGFNVDVSRDIRDTKGRYDLAVSMCSNSAIEILAAGVPVLLDESLENNKNLLREFITKNKVFCKKIENVDLKEMNDFYLKLI